ncbi:recombinase family protein [Streptomyces sp. NPDC101249]|uniref:recombinase family protein n=1 Tax=Streptomyces sp. NPDC101249 TaxID=3366140 RepID=UPI0037F81CAD
MFYSFTPPIDLSDLPGFEATSLRPRCPVFVGRVSTKDNQNPASSIPRQVALASACLAPGEEFAAYFWDVESGMLPLESRSLGPAEMYESLRVSTPRDGGVQDLLATAAERGVTHALAERGDRVARVMLTSLTVEDELRRLGVEVVYANEPVGGTESGRLRARRYSQVEAEVYKTVLMEMSMGGQYQHAAQGYNHGYAPYPYIRVVDEDAQVQPRRYGTMRPKHRLAPHPDGRRFEAAAELCRLRREGFRTIEIMRVLDASPDRYPPAGKWTRALVDGLIANPKLTGYQVFNRKAPRTGRDGTSKRNPISDWVWSPTPVHEPVITLEEWKEAQEVTASLRGKTAVGALPRLQIAARRLGLTATLVRSTRTHDVWRFGPREVTLPRPLPDGVADQVIADLGDPS